MIIKGGNFEDQRGVIRFVNDFHFEGVKRFYLIKHPETSVVRAWQGHKKETKYFYPIAGSFLVAWVKIDDFENPSPHIQPEYYKLVASNSEILSVPPGYANGLKALEPNAELMVFSDMELKESEKEIITYPANWWLNWDGIK